MDTPALRELVNANFIRNRFSLTSGVITVPIELQSQIKDILPLIASDYQAGHYSEFGRPRIQVKLNGELTEPFNFEEFVSRVADWESALNERRLVPTSVLIYDNWRNPGSPESDFFAFLDKQNPYLRISDPLLHKERIQGYLHPFTTAIIEEHYLNL